MEAILRAIPKEVAIATYVRTREALHIYNRPVTDVSKPKEKIDLQPIIDSGLLKLVSPNSESEQNDVVYFSQKDLNTGQMITTGEAITGAIAKSRNWAMGLDDKDAIAMFSRELPNLQRFPTLFFVQHWEQTSQPTPDMVRQVLQNISLRARHRPKATDSYYSWWESRIKQTIASPGSDPE